MNSTQTPSTQTQHPDPQHPDPQHRDTQHPHCQRWAEYLAGHTDEEFTAWTSAATPAWVRTTAEYAALTRPDWARGAYCGKGEYAGGHTPECGGRWI